MGQGMLRGKVAIVTGAGSPIGTGHAMALALARAGARVALLDLNREWLAQNFWEVPVAAWDRATGRPRPGMKLSSPSWHTSSKAAA